MQKYSGAKNGSGVYQKIINQLPPHDVFIEAFFHSGAITRLKRPATVNFGIDIDKRYCKLRRDFPKIDKLKIINGDAISLLAELVESQLIFYPRVLVYADPPYLGSSRSSSRPIYKHEMLSDDDHLEMLKLLKSLPCMVALSGYMSDMYARELKDWRTIHFQSMTRGGFAATEYLWLNYPVPFELHDYQYLGDNFRERERIARKKKRWVARLKKMPTQERYAILHAVNIVKDGEPSSS